MLMEIFNFKLPNGEILKLQWVKNNKDKFIAKCPPLLILFNIGNIQIDDLFSEFTYEEQVAIIYHELWHYHNNLKFEIKFRTKKPWLWLLFFINKPIYYEQEFNADMHALDKTNKKDILNVLKKVEKMIKEEIISKSHEKTHPPIEERIKRIEKLED